jgi:organic radical activating enzyme
MQIFDIFYSFQGEGPYIGYPQIFIRFAGCNLNCHYCDELSHKHKLIDLSEEEVLQAVQDLLKHKPHSISLTGGEPLLQVNEIKNILPQITLPIYLETNGTLPQHLSEIIQHISIASVDFKPTFEKEFIDFIHIIHKQPKIDYFIKYIVTKEFLITELVTLTKIMKSINQHIPLILQPVTPFSGMKDKATKKDIFRAYNYAKSKLNNIRIIPQAHKMMGIP